MLTRGSRAMLRPFTVSSPVLKTMAPSSTSIQIGAACGRPSARTVLRMAGRGSATRNAHHASSDIDW
jgi:hypothetical protein